MKKFIKDAITIVLGLITLFWGMMTRAAMIPDEEYHHCESGKEEWSVYQFVICFAISLLFFVLNVIIQKIGFKKLLSLIFWIIAIGVVLFFLLILYMGIYAIPPGGE